MLPLLGVLSALSLIDRSNLGLARTAGMDHDLVSIEFMKCCSSRHRVDCINVRFQHLGVGARYSIVSSIYFIPYVLL
jgi:hypothetical protein